MIVIALDPGGTTGGVVVQRPWTVISAAQIPTTADLTSWLDAMVPDIVVAESFKLYPWKAKSLSYSEMPSAEVLGVIKLWCQNNNVELVLQPAAAMKTISNNMLKECGLWDSTRGMPHARDAARHVLLWAMKHWLSEIIPMLKVTP